MTLLGWKLFQKSLNTLILSMNLPILLILFTIQEIQKIGKNIINAKHLNVLLIVFKIWITQKQLFKFLKL